MPNVLLAYAFDEKKLRAFTDMYNDLMLGESGLSKLEREMIAVAVSREPLLLLPHRARRGGAPALGRSGARRDDGDELPRRRADAEAEGDAGFRVKLTETPAKIEEATAPALRAAGFSDRDIWDIASTAAFFNMSNRVAAAIDMRPNAEYHSMAR
jgi:alkylhydroperoxidase family enzyme